MKAVVVLNGAPPAPERLRELAASHPVYAADGGARACLAAGIRPEWVAGDLDSFPKKDAPDHWELHHHPEQTRTDFQKVMGDLPPTVGEVRVVGGLGRRTDHLLTNLMIAAGFPASLRVTFEGAGEELTRVTAECPFERGVSVGDTVSLLPLPRAEGVVTRGLRWNLDQASMAAGGQLGQSNEATGPVEISITSGCLYVWVEPRMDTDFPPKG